MIWSPGNKQVSLQRKSEKTQWLVSFAIPLKKQQQGAKKVHFRPSPHGKLGGESYSQLLISKMATYYKGQMHVVF
jgi:hypothetical protein